jgi:hypothetical protein
MGKDNLNGHRQSEQFSLNKRNSRSVRKTPPARPSRAGRRVNASLCNAKHARVMWGAIPRIALDNLALLT